MPNDAADLFELPGAYVLLAPLHRCACITYTPGSWSDLLEVTRYAKARGWVIPNDPKRGIVPTSETLTNGDVRITLAPADEVAVAISMLTGFTQREEALSA